MPCSKKHLDSAERGQRRGSGLSGEKEKSIGGDWEATAGLGPAPPDTSDSCLRDLQILETPWTA